MKILIAGSRSIHSYDVKQHINGYATIPKIKNKGVKLLR